MFKIHNLTNAIAMYKYINYVVYDSSGEETILLDEFQELRNKAQQVTAG